MSKNVRLLLCVLISSDPPVHSGSRPGVEPSGGGADHLHGGQAHVHAAVCVRGELSVLHLQRGAGQLLPPPAALLLPDPQQRPVRLPAQSRQTLLGVARVSQVGVTEFNRSFICRLVSSQYTQRLHSSSLGAGWRDKVVFHLLLNTQTSMKHLN